MQRKKELTPQELLTQIENPSQVTNDAVVTLYTTKPSGWYNSNDDAQEQETHKKQREALAAALKHPKCPENLTVKIILTSDRGDLDENKRIRTPIRPIFQMLGRGLAPKGLTIKLERSGKDSHYRLLECNALQRALTSGKCPEDLTLNFGKMSTTGWVERTTDVSMESELYFLIDALKSGKCPFGLKVNYERDIPKVDEFEDNKLFDELDRLLENNDKHHIETEISEISDDILNKLAKEMASFLNRKLVNHEQRPEDLKHQETNAKKTGEKMNYQKYLHHHKSFSEHLNTKDKDRFNELKALYEDIIEITDKTIKNINPSLRDEWKSEYQASVLNKITERLKPGNKLEKYNSNQKIGLTLINYLTCFLAIPNQILLGRWSLFSTEGKSKEAVLEAQKIAESITPKKS